MASKTKVVWKDVEGAYGVQVSNEGNIRSIKDESLDITGERVIKKYVIRSLDRSGSCMDRIKYKGQHLKVPYLNMAAHGTKRPSPDYEIYFKDGDHHNNHIDNLGWRLKQQKTKKVTTEDVKEPDKNTSPHREFFQKAITCANLSEEGRNKTEIGKVVGEDRRRVSELLKADKVLEHNYKPIKRFADSRGPMPDLVPADSLVPKDTPVSLINDLKELQQEQKKLNECQKQNVTRLEVVANDMTGINKEISNKVEELGKLDPLLDKLNNM